MTRITVASLAACLAVLAGCAATDDSASNAGESNDSAFTSDADRKAAFENVKDALAQEAGGRGSIKTISVTVDATTDPSVITRIVPPTNPNPNCDAAASPHGEPCIARGETPKNLAGTYWMRGNPLPDYLLSFANTHWTMVKDHPYGYLATFAPGSFGWKEKIVAKGAAANDLKFVPKICRVPESDPAIAEIARHQSTYAPNTYRRSIADDYAEFEKAAGTDTDVSEADKKQFLDGVQNAGQLPLDGDQTVRLLAGGKLFYEAKFNATYTESSVIVFGLLAGPTVRPQQIGIPEELASFSFAPHPNDPNIYVRKSFVEGLSKTPNYYLLTRIVDGDGRPIAPHYQDFLRCVQERSEGRIEQVALTAQ
jgi:hypothetical protein